MTRAPIVLRPLQTPLVAMVLAALLAWAPTVRAEGLSTRQYLEICETDLNACEKEVLLADVALRAVLGGIGGIPVTLYCSIVPDISDESTTTVEDEEHAAAALTAATKVVRWWLADRPDLAEEDTSRSVVDALLAIYPCPQ